MAVIQIMDVVVSMLLLLDWEKIDEKIRATRMIVKRIFFFMVLEIRKGAKIRKKRKGGKV